MFGRRSNRAAGAGMAVVLGVVSALTTVAAGSQTPEADAGWPSFRKADADNSGAISLDEARRFAGVGDRFADHDKNDDGRLSRAEYEAAKRNATRTSERPR